MYWRLVPLLLLGCNVDATAGNSHGVPAPNGGPCPDGVSVVMSDYAATQIALGEVEGRTLSPSFLSTASTRSDGLAFALSGDVVLPSERTLSGYVVVVDRYGTNVVSWANPVTAEVEAQLAVGTGFNSNPQDYVEVAPDRAYVSRWGVNGQPGKQPFDSGADVLVLNTERHAIVGRIELDGAPATSTSRRRLPSRAGRFTRLGGLVLVTLDPMSLDFDELGDTELVAIDTQSDTVAWRTTLEGLKNCGRPAVSPDQKQHLVLSCSGQLDFTGQVVDPAESGLVVLDAAENPPREIQRVPAALLADDPLQGEVEFASTRTILVKTQTQLGGASHNRLLAIDRESLAVSVLLEARPDRRGKGQGIVYGAVVCQPGCSDVCLMADADRHVLQRLVVDADGTVQAQDELRIEGALGLPPVGISYR